MEIRRGKNPIIAILVLLFASIITQCAASKPEVIKKTDEANLRQRVQEYWNYRINGQWDKAFELELPDYREEKGLVKYIAENTRSLTKWEGFEVLELWTSGDEGFVKMNVKFRFLVPDPKIRQKVVLERVAEEKWLMKGGQWYRFSG